MTTTANTVWAYNPALAATPTAAWTQLTLGEPLHRAAEGGTARIVTITTPGFENHVAKMFNAVALPRRRTEASHDKLSFITRVRPLLVGGRGQVPPRPYVGWPELMLYDRQEAKSANLLGFAMPVFPDAQPLTTFVTPRHRARFFKHVTPDAGLFLAARIADQLALLHGKDKPSGILFGDLTARNMLVSPGLKVTFIDADSYQYAVGGVTHGSNESTPGYRAPRIAEADRARQTLPVFTAADDAFALAILIFAILVDGAHPYRAGAGFEIGGAAPDDEDNMLAKRFPYADAARMQPPKIRLQTYSRLPDEIKQAFEAAFVHHQPPTPLAWVELLSTARAQASRGVPPTAVKVAPVAPPKPVPRPVPKPHPVTALTLALTSAVVGALQAPGRPVKA
jgi:DNA-binding helix-hairpin-helix protein with protein kinase domain